MKKKTNILLKKVYKKRMEKRAMYTFFIYSTTIVSVLFKRHSLLEVTLNVYKIVQTYIHKPSSINHTR